MHKIDSKCEVEDFDWLDPITILLLVALISLTLVVLISNTFIIVAICKTPRLQNVTNMFIVTLAISDLLIGILVLPFSFNVAVQHWIFGGALCIIWRLTAIWTCSASIWNFCIISVVRYIAITRPLKYNQIMSEKRAKIMIATVWIVTFLICCPPLIHWNSPYEPCLKRCHIICDIKSSLYILIGSFFIPSLVLITCYSRIYFVAARARQANMEGYRNNITAQNNNMMLRIHKGRHSNMTSSQSTVFTVSKAFDSIENLPEESGVPPTTSNQDQGNPLSSSNPDVEISHSPMSQIKHCVKKLRIENKAARTVGIIIGVFICCWCPFAIVYILDATILADKIPSTILNLTGYIGLCNSAMNPWICVIFYKELGNVVKELFKKVFCIVKINFKVAT